MQSFTYFLPNSFGLTNWGPYKPGAKAPARIFASAPGAAENLNAAADAPNPAPIANPTLNHSKLYTHTLTSTALINKACK